MKKIGIGILFLITFFIIYFLEANIFPFLTINGILPNLFVIFILFIGLFANTAYGVFFGTICGLILDFIYGKCIGISAVMLCVVGYLGSYFDKNFSKENKITIILMVAGSTIIFEAGYYLLSSIIIDFELEWLAFFKILAIEVLYNVLLSIILYPIIQKAGYSVDRIFKKNNVLTRYF